jgi:hypothetical protein
MVRVYLGGGEGEGEGEGEGSFDGEYWQVLPRVIFDLLNDGDLWRILEFLTGEQAVLGGRGSVGGEIRGKLLLADGIEQVLARRFGLLEILLNDVFQIKFVSLAKTPDAGQISDLEVYFTNCAATFLHKSLNTLLKFCNPDTLPIIRLTEQKFNINLRLILLA